MGYQERLGAVAPPMPPAPAYMPPAYTPPAQPTLAAQPAYADRFAVPPTLAAQPNYADRFAVPGSATSLPSFGLPPLPPAGALGFEEWATTTFSDGMPPGITAEALTGGYETYLNNVEQQGPRYGN